MAEPLSYSVAVAATLALLVGSGVALHRCSHLPAGHLLLGAVAAVCIAINFAAPLLLFDPNTCHSTRGMATFAITWIASSKALALFCGRGQLAARRWRLPQFLALYTMPLLADTETPPPGIGPRAKLPGASAAVAPAAEGSGGGGGLAQRTAVNAAITALCLLGAVSGPPLLVKQALLSLAMYGWLGFQLGLLEAVALPWLGLRLQPLFRPPWTEARSLAAFWGRCWNLACSDAVRIAVYEPLCEGTLIRRNPGAALGGAGRARRPAAASAAGRGGRRALALCAGFLTSGTMHEFIMWAIAGQTTRGYWFAFFSLQGPLILAERRLVASLGQSGVKLPAALRTAATLCLLMAVAHPLFYNPVDRIPLFGRYVVLWRSWFEAVGSTASGLLA